MALFAAGTSLLGGLFSSSRKRREQQRAITAQENAQRSAQQAAQAQSDKLLEAGRFKPYGVTNAFSNTSFTTAEDAKRNEDYARANGFNIQSFADGRTGYTDANGGFVPTSAEVRNKLSGRVQAGVDNSLAAGDWNVYNAMKRSEFSPEDLAKDRFGRYLEMVRPRQMADLDQLAGGTNLQGTTGFRSNITGSNPVFESFAKGMANSDKEAYDRSILQEQQLTDMIQQRGLRDYAGAGAIEDLGSQNIELGAALGGRGVNSNAGASAAMATNAANSMAQMQGQAAQSRMQSNNLFTDTLTGGVGNFINSVNGGPNGGGIQRSLTNIFGGSGAAPGVPNMFPSAPGDAQWLGGPPGVL